MEKTTGQPIETGNYKYFAFISYSSKDVKWGKRLHKKLEYFRLPSTLCSERGWKRKPMNPVFFAPYEIQPGGLDAELQQRLTDSQNLIVIGSPNSARSEWVGKEIEFFHNLGRTDKIHYFIVDGEPGSGNPETECYNPILKKLGIPEILGSNIHERTFRWPWLNKERAFIQLVSKLLGVGFDSLWRRHRRRLVRNLVLWIVGLVALITALLTVWVTNQPFDSRVSLEEVTMRKDNLDGLENAKLTLTLDNEIKQATIVAIDSSALLTNIPHCFLDKPVRMTLKAEKYVTLDTTLLLTRNVVLNLNRDVHYYGDVRFQVWSKSKGRGVSGARLKVHGIDVIADEDGYVSLFIPLERQQKSYRVEASFPIEDDSLAMPYGENDAVVTE